MNQKYIKNRYIFYIPGYDPRGARHYYNLYKKEAKKQSKISNFNLEIGKRKKISSHISKWNILYRDSKHTTKTDYYFCEWDDIIRKNWKKNYFTLLKDIFFYIRVYIFSGLFLKYLSKIPRQTIGFLYPAFYTLISILLITVFIKWSYLYSQEYLNNILLTIFITLITSIISISFFLYIAKKLAIFWLSRVFLFSYNYATKSDDNLEERINYFSQYIKDKILSSDFKKTDEIIIISHSVGTILTIPIVNNLLKEDIITKDNKLSILTLGECIPLVSGVPDAKSYRQKLCNIAKSENIKWMDITSIIDGACFPQLNFFEDSNCTIKNSNNFHFASPRFHTLFNKNSYNKIKRDKYKSHFLYLMATEKIGFYNYFLWTAGASSLDTRIKMAKGISNESI